MATTSVETSLSSLLPTLNGDLPPELVHLATSLLAQSRTRINLKPTEEIARPYVCAEIACKRLLSRLKLPAAHGRPPLPPKVYAKLLDLLEKGLQVHKPVRAKVDLGLDTAGSGSSPTKGPSTPRKRGAAGKETPSKSATSTPATAPSKNIAFAGRVSARKAAGAGAEEESPEWVMPLIRRLCTTFNTPMLPPHVYTGACVVLKLAGLWPPSEPDQEDDFRSTVAAMTIAIYFMVLTKMQQGKITREVYLDRCEKAVEVAAEIGSGSFNKDAVDEWIKKMNDKGWCRAQDWWDSVPEDVMDVVEPHAGNAENYMDGQDDAVGSKRKRRRLMEDDQAGDDKDGVLLPGLGTMMQDAVDFLSEERTLAYLEWKKEIIERMQYMEKGKGRAVSAR
jgi:origin recognition complex subunit 6